MTTPNTNTQSDGQGETIPDLYKLLALEPLESDHAKLERALLGLQKGLAKARDQKQIQRINRLIALTTKNLLDPQRKKIYDKAWVKVFGDAQLVPAAAVEHASSVAEVTWDLGELEAHLPVEDPRAAFDLGRFLQIGVGSSNSTPEGDFDKLWSLLGGPAAAVATELQKPSSAGGAVNNAAQPSITTAPSQLAPANVPPKSNSEVKYSGPKAVKSHLGGVSASVVARQLRRQRSRSTWMAVCGMFTAVGVVFGVAYWLVNQKGNGASASRQTAALTTQPPPSAPAVANPPPIESGLPKVPGAETLNLTPAEDASAQPPVVTAAESPAMPVVVAPNNEPTPEPVLSDAERQAWAQDMRRVRNHLRDQEFEPAKSLLSQVGSTAKSSLQKEQFQRLALLAELVQEFTQYLRQAIGEMQSGQTITVGNSPMAAFVEADGDQVTFRLSGKNMSFKLSELPVGLAYGVADLKMDTAHPRSLARKAAFAAVHPTIKSIGIEAAKQFWSQAAAEQAVPPGMEKVFDENYELLTR